MRPCSLCGTSFFASGTTGGRRKFCSKTCSDTSGSHAAESRRKARRRCGGCGCALEHWKQLCEPCRSERRHIHEQGRPPSRKRVMNCERCRAVISVYRTTGRCRKCSIRLMAKPTPCTACQQPVERRDGHRVAMCEDCLASTQRKAAFDKLLNEIHRLRTTAAGYSVRCCLECRVEFESRKTKQAFCLACTRARNHRLKKARRRGAPGLLPPLHQIFTRDQGVCQLCHQAVDRRLTPNHRLAATLDHIVPVSKGGSHHEDNIQLAHRGCNSGKRDRVAA